MWDSVVVTEDQEGHLLELSTGLDISGGNREVPADLRGDVLARYPRLGLAEEFVACFAAESARKPQSTAAGAVASGIAGRIAANVLDR